MNNANGLAGGIGLMLCLVSAPARAQPVQRYDIAAMDLAAALRLFAATSGREVVAASEIVAGRRSARVAGNLSPEQALAQLLAPSGLRAELVDGAFVLRPLEVAASAPAAADEGQVVVTGTRIRGAPVASPVISLRREALQRAGQATIADALRAVPQNFGGGQNPGIGFNVPEASGADVGGGASVNLRGLGSDATLTLLNGRRLSYSGPSQSVDVSAIPFGAIARVEIVPDGASALFGSDAVAGVVNIILRRDLDGLEVGGRLGASTDGGNVQQQYAATGGKTWRSGSALLAYEFGRNSAIEARQRSYARQRTPGLTLFPELRRHSAMLVVSQRLTERLSLDLDGGYNKRWSDTTYPLNVAGDLSVSRATSFTVAESFIVAPALKWQAPANWQVALAGSYGSDRVAYGGDLFFGTTRVDPGSGTYRSRSRNVELSGNGGLFDGPGGKIKAALGAGYRRNGFARVTSAGATQDLSHAQDSYYAFGELNVPVIAGTAGGSDRLAASAAVRYERYPGIGEVATPKLGFIYAPTADIALKGSWGRSFRAPTLYQQYQPRLAYLLRASSLGATGRPATATGILLAGGSDTLKPERSTNWSATVDLHPRALPGASLEMSYFSVRYRDRIVTPLPFFSVALSDPRYAASVIPNPSAAAQAGAIASAASFQNITGSATYDPAAVVAIVDNTSVNAGRQRAHGIDVLARYARTQGRNGLTASVNASYLASDQQLTAGQAVTPLSGELFNPPHWRARGELALIRGSFSATGALSYIGPVRDRRDGADQRVAGMTPLDLTLRYAGERGGGLLDGLDVTVSIQNLLNDKPSVIATSLFYDTPYDSTNQSPFGRVVSIAVQKKW